MSDSANDKLAMFEPTKLEKKLLKRHRSYRAARVGAICLAAIGMLTGLGMVWLDKIDLEIFGTMLAPAMFWIAMAYYANARLQHIATIRRQMYCPKCDYDMRGSPGGICPECGFDTHGIKE